MDATQANPALAGLAVLAGTWTLELWGAAFLPSPETRVTGGIVRIEWIEGGALLAIRHEGVGPAGPPQARMIIGRDDGSDDYTVLYSDSRGVSRVYAMSLDESHWRMWRDSSTFAQRFEAVLSPDRNTMTGRWEKAVDGGPWEHDFNLAYTREPG